MPEIRTLTLAEMKSIYEEYMENDFPRAELRPFSSMKKNFEKGNYAGFGFYEGEKFLAYACFYNYDGADQALMDYFAVVPELRGQGIGSAFLQAMIPKLPAGSGILIEAESADSAENEAERTERERRLSFYERNGAILTGIRCYLLSVDYEIMLIPGPGLIDSLENTKAAGQSSQSTDAGSAVSEVTGAGSDRSPQNAPGPQAYYDMLDRMYKNLYGPIFGKFCKLYIKDPK